MYSCYMYLCNNFEQAICYPVNRCTNLGFKNDLSYGIPHIPKTVVFTLHCLYGIIYNRSVNVATDSVLNVMHSICVTKLSRTSWYFVS